MRTAIDTNVISAIWAGESTAEKASEFLDEAGGRGGLVISPVVFVELRGHPHGSENLLTRFLGTMLIDVDWMMDRPVWELAAERFARYAKRRRGQAAGEPRRFPADFLIAAHAILAADRLVTLDQGRYRTDFPELVVAEI